MTDTIERLRSLLAEAEGYPATLITGPERSLMLVHVAVSHLPALLDVADAARGCGDGACILRDPRDRGGMRTNGGCDCRRTVLHALRRLDEVPRG